MRNTNTAGRNEGMAEMNTTLEIQAFEIQIASVEPAEVEQLVEVFLVPVNKV